jgi:hypothetical protein
MLVETCKGVIMYFILKWPHLVELLFTLVSSSVTDLDVFIKIMNQNFFRNAHVRLPLHHVWIEDVREKLREELLCNPVPLLVAHR